MSNTRKYLKRSASKSRRTGKRMTGGSPASSRVMEMLNDKVATRDYVESPRIRTSSTLGNTDTYSLTGGGCGCSGKKTDQFGGARKSRSRKSRVRKSRVRKSGVRKSRVRKSGVRKSHKRQRGGYGSDWMSSQYSLSLAPQSHKRAGQFSKGGVTGRDVLLNPPNRGLAGSGN
jgi:hypothetical protein